MLDWLRKLFMDGIKRNRTADLDFSEDTKRFLRELFGESIGSPSAATKLDAIIEMLHPVADVPFIKQELSIVHGLQADVLTAINNLDRKVDEAVMGLKEDHQALTGRFDKLDEATQLVADDIAALKREIAEANDRANIDLTPLMSRADAIEARLRGSAGSQAGSDPETPAPEPEPTEPV